MQASGPALAFQFQYLPHQCLLYAFPCLRCILTLEARSCVMAGAYHHAMMARHPQCKLLVYGVLHSLVQ